jgi:hypothetical protein
MPETVEYDPAAQLVQLTAPLLAENVPAGQFWQALAAVAPDMVEKVPEKQLVHELNRDPPRVMDQDPDGQFTQVEIEVARTTLEYVPS